MDNFKLWAYSLCGAIVITSVFKLIVFDSRLTKSINIFLSVFIFFYSINPLSDIGNLFDISVLDSNNVDESEIYLEGFDKIVVESINSVCDDNNVTIISIEIDSYIDNDDNYVVNKIIVETDSPERNEEMESTLYEQLKFEVDMV